MWPLIHSLVFPECDFWCLFEIFFFSNKEFFTRKKGNRYLFLIVVDVLLQVNDPQT